MSDEVIHGLSADSKRVPSKWTRNTVADGSWLQNYTLSPLSARDFYLASAIDTISDNISADLEAEIAARIEGDTYISGVLDTVSSDFYNFSGKVEISAANITNTINVFSGKVEQSAANLNTNINIEVSRATDAEEKLAGEIASMSSTVADNYLSANGDAVQSGHNIVITKPDGDNIPHIKIETSSHVTFDGVSSTDLSATNASGTNLKYDFVTATNLSSTAISAKDLIATNIYSDYVSLNLNKTVASQSQGTSSATLNSNGISAFDSQAGSTPYYSTWIDIISGTNLQNGNYVYIDRTLNTVNLSSDISANHISAGTSITFPGDSTHSALLNATGLGFSSKNTYGTVSAYYGVDYMYLSAGGRPGSEVKFSPTNFIASYMSNSYNGLWKDVASASKLAGSNCIYITTSNIDTLYHITLSSNISATYLSAFNINQEYVNNTYTARLSSNADSVEMWQHTQGQPGNTTGIAKWAYIIRNNETRNGTMAKMNSGDYISGNGTITALVSASTIGTDSHVLYLV